MHSGAQSMRTCAQWCTCFRLCTFTVVYVYGGARVYGDVCVCTALCVCAVVRAMCTAVYVCMVVHVNGGASVCVCDYSFCCEGTGRHQELPPCIAGEGEEV